MKKNGMTLIEMMFVLVIFTVLFAAMMNILVQSNRTWSVGRAEQELQQEARKALDRVVKELRLSNLRWEANSLYYCLNINSAGDQLEFYLPTFDTYGNITALTAVRYYVGGTNSDQLLRRVGVVDKVVAVDINNVAGQKPFFDFTTSLYTEATCTCLKGGSCCTDVNCAVSVKIPVRKSPYSFSINSSVALRNREANLGSVEVTEIEQEQ